jgi:S-DNA-T family DNA segregation ATPase FtsK/SpoIIIE
MAAKTPPSESTRGSGRHHRRREISGILLLAGGLFAGLSLIAMHVGDNRMMGIGGEAIAGALYAVAGLGAYLIVAGMLVGAVRCFRGRRVIDGAREAGGTLLLVGSVGILLYLPFADSGFASHGPGGALGEWLGGIGAAFIGSVGAALGATTTLVVSLLLITEVSTREVMVVLAWAGRHAVRGIVAGARGTWRVMRAAFPEKDDRDDRNRREPEADDADGEIEDGVEPIQIHPAMAEGHDEGEITVETTASGRLAAEMDAVPETMEAQESEGVRVGEAHSVSEKLVDPERAAMAAIVAEVAAVERFAPEPEAAAAAEEEEKTEKDLPAIAVPPPPPPPVDGPIIVEPASIARLRQQEAADAAAAAELTAEEAARLRDEKRGFIKLGDGEFQLPATDLLEYIPPTNQEMDKQPLYDMAERLEQAMSNYGVRGKVKEIHMGPVVTMYEFAPAPGTRTGKIANLEKDLAMALEAQAVRIVAPIPGKAVVGVEVPNKSREMVYLKEILQDASFATASSKLQVALGKDIKGAPVSVNLSKMPHLLVAGTTGSGKSVAVNGMITSVLYNASPEDVRFIMVDPKMLELSIYEGIPHLLLPVVTDPKKANLALRWAVDEMERRYELLAKTGVRDIASYNAKIEGAEKKEEAAAASAGRKSDKKIRVVIAGPDGTEQEVDLDADAEITLAEGADGDTAGIVNVEAPSDEDLSDAAAKVQADKEKAAQGKEEEKPTKLPYIVIVIDEFADLMMVAPKDVETSVARLAQKARAAGLHLILATQRPSVDVITGLIKANFPSRIALQVASRIDSRTILDQQGAETLLGNGDMLFSDRGTKLRRIHGAFLSDNEVHRVVEFLKQQAKPVYDMDILKPREEDAEEGGAPASDFHDEFYDQAVAIVCETRQASVSYIQRRLQIGYNRAARMVEQMERDGIVGPTNGAKPREVIAPPGEYLSAAGA